MDNQILYHWHSENRIQASCIWLRVPLFFFFEFEELIHDPIWINFCLLISLSAWLLQGIWAVIEQISIFESEFQIRDHYGFDWRQ